MKERKLSGKLFISTTADDCREEALRFGLGPEIADFCWAQRIDVGRDEHIAEAKKLTGGLPTGIFHAPFAEITPCAIDPRVRELTSLRYRQSIEIARELGINRLVIHGGFIPQVYYPEHYVSESVAFWKEFLKDAPPDIRIALENVMEPSPDTLIRIADGVDDPRLGLCLDLGHANCSISETPPLEWIRPMAHRLFHVHLHDNLGGRDLHAPLGEGTVPAEEAIKTVSELCPEATFTVENMHCAGSMEWLAAKGYV
ncbi:MAG: sugar phosphate isomerase/epimerase [Clostridia bacterium]|nr:sugar phosphate isomerase/epimerase [Clostridia bacterium]